MKYVLIIVIYHALFVLGIKLDAVQDSGWLMALMLVAFLAGYFFLYALFMAMENRYSSVGATIAKAQENFRWIAKNWLVFVGIMLLLPTVIGLAFYFLVP